MTLRDALKLMDEVDARGAAKPFSIHFCTLDRSRKTGGAMRYIPKAVRCGAKHNLQRARQIAVKPLDGGHPVPVHLMLITRVNGQPVL